jgi:hypothetical protein
MSINIGPIIGLVSSNSANILLEFDEDIINLQCVMINLSNQQVCYISTSNGKLNFRKNIPKVITFIDLPSNTLLEFKITDVRIKNSISAKIRTFSINPDEFNVVCIKYNDINLWRHIAEQNNRIDLLLHLGSQVDLYECVHTLLQDEIKINIINTIDDAHNYIKEIFRSCYRTNWSRQYIREIMASCQNLMIWDEHDSLIRFNKTIAHPSQSIQLTQPEGNDNISKGNDNIFNMNEWNSKIKKNIDLVKCAYEVYCEYQKQLWQPLSEIKTLKFREHHYHKWGKFGVFMIDTIGNLHTSKELLSRTQIRDLQKFRNSPELNFFIFASPESFINNMPCDNDIVLNTWPSHDKKYYIVFKYLEKWQKQNQDKKIILLSGNYGANTTITNTHHGHMMNMISVGYYDNKVMSPKKIIKYKKWIIQQHLFLENSYSSIVLHTKDNVPIIDAKLIGAYNIHDCTVQHDINSVDISINVEKQDKKTLMISDINEINNANEASESDVIELENINISTEISQTHPEVPLYPKQHQISVFNIRKNNDTKNEFVQTTKQHNIKPSTVSDAGFEQVLNVLSEIFMKDNFPKTSDNKHIKFTNTNDIPHRHSMTNNKINSSDESSPKDNNHQSFTSKKAINTMLADDNHHSILLTGKLKQLKNKNNIRSLLDTE